MHSFLRAPALLSAGVVLASCAGYQPLGMTFIRADGQDVDGEHLAADRTACTDGRAKLESCMSGKGYALVKDDEAAVKQKEFAEATEKKRQEQLAAVVAEKKKQATARRRTRKPAAREQAQAKGAAPATAAQTMPTNPAPSATNAQASPWPKYSSNPQAGPWPEH
jgi:hypothetical protein